MVRRVVVTQMTENVRDNDPNRIDIIQLYSRFAATFHAETEQIAQQNRLLRNRKKNQTKRPKMQEHLYYKLRKIENLII